MLSRRSFLVASAALGVITHWPAGGAFAQSKRAVKVAVGSRTLAYGPLYVAMQKGYFAEENLELNIETIAGAPAVTAALIAGAIDIGLPGTNGAVLAAARGQPIKIVGNITVGSPTALVFNKDYAARKGINEASSTAEKLVALKGARILAGQPGSSNYIVMEYYLKANGIDPQRDVEFVPVTDQAAMLTALRSGQGDALLFGPPLPNQAVIDGYAIRGILLASEPALKEMAWVSVAVTNDWAAANRNVAVSFLRALARGQDLIARSEADARATVRKQFSSMDNALFDEAWSTFRPSYPATPAITEANVAKVIEIINMSVTPAVAAGFADVATNEFVESALN